ENQRHAAVARARRRGASFAIEQGDLAEEFSGTEDVQDQALALHGVHGEGDAAHQDAVEDIAGIAFLEEDVSGRNVPGPCALQQRVSVLLRKLGEERMEAEQVLGRHSSGTVPWPTGSLASYGRRHKS